MDRDRTLTASAAGADPTPIAASLGALRDGADGCRGEERRACRRWRERLPTSRRCLSLNLAKRCRWQVALEPQQQFRSQEHLSRSLGAVSIDEFSREEPGNSQRQLNSTNRVVPQH